jgi:predicted RNase H-like HicB family nuclease
MRYLVVIEPTATGYSAYAPDLPGCVSTGATRDEAETNMREAVDLHLRGLRLEGLEVPRARTSSAYLEVTPVRTYTEILVRPGREDELAG